MKFPIHKILTPFIFLFFSVSIFGQEWTEPIKVSDMEGAYLDPDMCIDNNGVIHVVWSSGTFGSNNWQILYSKSENNGETWSEDYDVSQNDTLWMSQPHIANDSENNLYVTYDYNTMQPSYMHVLMKIYNGQTWSDSILITEGMPGSDYNKLIVDNNDDIIIGWYRNSKYYYKFYGNGSLSNEYCPYCDSTDIFLPVEFSLSTNQIIKWIGSSSSLNYYNSRLQYYEHSIFNNQWYQPELVDSSNIQVGKDIALNIFENPEISYRIETSVWPNPFTDATMYNNYNGQNWSGSEMVVEDPEDQQIAIDQYDLPHIVNREKTITGYQIVHYSNINDEWVGYVIDSTPNFCNPTKLLFYNDQLYLLYFRDSIPGYPDVNIMLTKYDLTTSIKNNRIHISTLTVYPNPTSGQINISFELSEVEDVSMFISDFRGRHIKTLISRKMQAGEHLINWDGKNENGLKVNSGIYLCRLYCKRNVITKSIEIIN